MARAGLTSRREAKALLEQGLVRVNGKVITEPFYEVNPANDLVEFKGETVKLERIGGTPGPKCCSRPEQSDGPYRDNQHWSV